MIYEIDDTFDEKVSQLLTQNGVKFEAIESPFLLQIQTGLWQAIYDLCGKIPEELQGDIYAELYLKIPEMAKLINHKDMEDMSYGNDDAPLRIAAIFEEAFYDEYIEKELEKLENKTD